MPPPPPSVGLGGTGPGSRFAGSGAIGGSSSNSYYHAFRTSAGRANPASAQQASVGSTPSHIHPSAQQQASVGFTAQDATAAATIDAEPAQPPDSSPLLYVEPSGPSGPARIRASTGPSDASNDDGASDASPHGWQKARGGGGGSSGVVGARELHLELVCMPSITPLSMVRRPYLHQSACTPLQVTPVGTSLVPPSPT